jgi:hypothetical protein
LVAIRLISIGLGKTGKTFSGVKKKGVKIIFQKRARSSGVSLLK